MSVNRYECGLTNAPTEYQSPTMYQDENGGYVSHEDYAALEARCAALAVENAKKSRCLGFFASVIKSGESWTRVCQHEYDEAQETPDTDAFLAEVRAQGADECVRQLVISDDDDFSDAPNICAMVAHQFRQDASTAELVAAGIITKVEE